MVVKLIRRTKAKIEDEPEFQVCRGWFQVPGDQVLHLKAPQVCAGGNLSAFQLSCPVHSLHCSHHREFENSLFEKLQNYAMTILRTRTTPYIHDLYSPSEEAPKAPFSGMIEVDCYGALPRCNYIQTLKHQSTDKCSQVHQYIVDRGGIYSSN